MLENLPDAVTTASTPWELKTASSEPGRWDIREVEDVRERNSMARFPATSGHVRESVKTAEAVCYVLVSFASL